MNKKLIKQLREGTIPENDPEYIWHLDEPYKILTSEVKIIDKENVTYDKRTGLCHVKSKTNKIDNITKT